MKVELDKVREIVNQYGDLKLAKEKILLELDKLEIERKMLYSSLCSSVDSSNNGMLKSTLTKDQPEPKMYLHTYIDDYEPIVAYQRVHQFISLNKGYFGQEGLKHIKTEPWNA